MTREYLSQEIPEAVLHTVLDRARKSPSAGHSQGVRLAVVRSEERRREIALAYGEPTFVAKGRRSWLSSAPVHVIVAVDEESYQQRYSEPDKRCRPEDWPIPYPVLDAGKALMTLYLAAQSFELSAGFLGSHAGPNLVEMLNLPEQWRYVGLVTLGFPVGKSESTRSKRRGWKPYEETVIWLD